MYNPKIVKENFRGLVGLRQVYGQYESLDPALTENIIQYLNHPLLDMENIVSSFRNAKKLGYKNFDVTESYPIGYRVIRDDQAYISLEENNKDNDPKTDTEKWKELNVLSEQLLLSIDGSIDKLVQSIFIRKKLNSLVKTIVDDFRLYDGRSEVINKNANNGRFVGFGFNLKQPADLTVVIPNISFQFDLACPDLKLYLFNTSQSAAVAVYPINYNQPGVVKWFDLVKLFNGGINLSSFADGDYKLGYFEGDLAPGAQSIKKETNLVHQEACGSCGGTDYDLYLRRSRYLDMQPFYVDAANLSGTDLWDESTEIYVEKNNWGMNLQLSIHCDLTDFICRNRMIFVEALALQATTDILLAMQYSGNDNQVLQKLQSRVNYAVNGSKDNFNLGLAKETDNAIKALDFDLSGLDKQCLPCNDQRLIGRRVM